MRHELWPIDAAHYVHHSIHDADRTWPETNCAVDLWVELLHSWGVEPIAALPFTVAIDFEGDQFTFFKFPFDDLYRLHGVEVFELTIWGRLAAHVEEQLKLGRPCIVEVDAFHLPDTAATSYGREHVKTAIAIQAIDREAGRLGYFHNGGYFELESADFNGVLRLTADLARPEFLAPYVEAVKLPARFRRTGDALVRASIECFRVHLERAPTVNPFRRYGTRLASDLPVLAGEALEHFHRYAFATLRQCGAAFELGATYLRWLRANGEGELEPLAAACDGIATDAKALQFKIARAVHTRRLFEPGPLVDSMAEAWTRVIAELNERYGVVARGR
jgi:hypothetical protein